MLRVSPNQRFLSTEEGRPFFYLGDTAWTLFQRLDRAEADRYLQDRAAKCFTVIQAVALSEFDGLSVPNSYGDLPLHGKDPAKRIALAPGCHGRRRCSCRAPRKCSMPED